jgi:FAD synthetase
MKKVMAFGTFDLLHPGHLHYLQEAKKYGDFLIVVVARDSTVLQVKQKLPKNNEEQRCKNLERLNIADKIVLGDKKDKLKIITDEKPDVLAFGYDQKMPVDDLKSKLDSNIVLKTVTALKPEIYKSSLLENSII